MSTAEYLINPVTPCRLDLTVAALRRLSVNLVDVLTPEGEYLRAFETAGALALAAVTQPRADQVLVRIRAPESDHPRIFATLRTTLGVDRDLSDFEQSSRAIPWLHPLVLRLQGLKPPRYPSLWEACVNTIVFQQISISAASAITNRIIRSLCTPIEEHSTTLYPFPSIATFQRADDAVLRAAGLSGNKVGTLRRMGEALESGALDPETLLAGTSREAALQMQSIKGIGPWTAAIILVRGLGRLDVFPPGDSSVMANLALVSDGAPFDLPEVLDTLGDHRGFLYFCLLLARLEVRGEIGRASVAARRPVDRRRAGFDGA